MFSDSHHIHDLSWRLHKSVHDWKKRQRELNPAPFDGAEQTVSEEIVLEMDNFQDPQVVSMRSQV